jgi:hypothetical protein
VSDGKHDENLSEGSAIVAIDLSTKEGRLKACDQHLPSMTVSPTRFAEMAVTAPLVFRPMRKLVRFGYRMARLKVISMPLTAEFAFQERARPSKLIVASNSSNPRGRDSG